MTNDTFFYTEEMTEERQLPGVTYVRLFHAAPGAPEVDVYANARLIGNRIAFGQFTDYITLTPGTYTIEAYAVGTHTNPILRIELPLSGNTAYTLALIGLLPRIGILPVEDEFEPVNPGRVNIRFVNLSPNAPSLTLALRGGMDLLTDVTYTEVSDYRSILPGQYNFIVRPANQPTIVTYVPNVRLLPRRNLTFYLVGMYGQQPSSLEVYIPLDGTTYLRE